MLGVIPLLLLASMPAHSDEGEGSGRVLDFNSARAARAQKEDASPTEALAPEVKPLAGTNKVVTFQPKAKPAQVDPNADILPILERMKKAAEEVVAFTQRDRFEGLTQNRVNILVRNIHTLEQNQFAADSYRHWSPTSEKLVDDVLAAQKRALEAVESSKLYERLEGEGFHVKLIPTALIKKTLPIELLESMREAAFTNQVRGIANFMQFASISPGLSRLQERLRLPPRSVKHYLELLSSGLDRSLKTLEQARSYLSKDGKAQYDLEGVDQLIEETRKGLSAKETRIGLSVLKKSLIKSDRELVAAIESKMKRIEPILGYIEMRGRFSTKPAVEAASTRNRGASAKFFDDLLTGSPEVQNERYARLIDSKGVPNEHSLEFIFSEGAYREGLSSEELLTIVRRISDRMPSSEKHLLPEMMTDVYRKLTSRFASPISPRGSGVAIMKMAAVLNGLGDEASYHALELIEAQSPRVIDRSTVFSLEGKEMKDYFKQLLTDTKTQHPEYKSSISIARRAGICVMNIVTTSLPSIE